VAFRDRLMLRHHDRLHDPAAGALGPQGHSLGGGTAGRAEQATQHMRQGSIAADPQHIRHRDRSWRRAARIAAMGDQCSLDQGVEGAGEQGIALAGLDRRGDDRAIG
jgi:hypothetical protein